MRRIVTALCFFTLGPLAAVAQDRPLGWLSERHEAAKEGPLAYNPGKHKTRDNDGNLVKGDDGEYKYTYDRGGPSYGTYQMASKRGVDGSSASAFVKDYYPADFLDPVAKSKGELKYLDPDAEHDAFRAKWAEVAKREGDRFTANEREFIYDTHYEPLVKLVKDKTGLDIDARGEALRNVAWSVAVQHGNPIVDPEKATGMKLFERALAKWTREQLSRPRGTTGSVDEGALIDAIYDERTARDKAGKMVYFPKENLDKRFNQERSDAQSARAREPLAPAPDLNKTDLGKLAKGIGIIAGPVRRPDPNLTVDKGQSTYDFSGYDRDFSNTRKASIPGDWSGVRIGRAYDLARVTREQAEKDLRVAGLSDAQVQVYAGAAGLIGEKARAYLNSLNYSRFSGEAQKMGLKGVDLSKYVNDRIPQVISTAQQKKLFEAAYGRAEAEAREQFPGFDRFPEPARAALTDLIYDRGTDALAKERPGLMDAARSEKWDEASVLSKRNGAGFERNRWTRTQFQMAATPPKTQ